MDPTPYPTPRLFPFEPDAADPILETWSFVTDVITSHNQTEFRTSLRTRPALKVSWRVTAVDPAEFAQLQGSLYDNIDNRWYVPLWQYRRKATSVAGTVYTPESMTGSRFQWSSKVLVWQGSGRADIMTVSAIGVSTVTLTGATTFNHTTGRVVLVPIGIGVLPISHSWQKFRDAGSGTVTFEVDTTDAPVLSATAPAQTHETHEVLSIHPSAGSGGVEEQWTNNSHRIGTVLGPFVMRPFGTDPIVTRGYQWVCDGYTEIAALYGWLMGRRGRRVPLWVPTYTDDFVLNAAPVGGNTYIDILACGFEVNFLPHLARSRIALLRPPSTVAAFTITGVTYPSAGVERLALSAAVGSGLPINTRVSLLALCRLEMDTIEIQHESTNIASTELKFQELPGEVT